MKRAHGVGIAGPQVGLSWRIAALELSYRAQRSETVVVCNPLILQRSDDCIEGYEGCLSVPGVGGRVRRSRWVEVSYQTLDGEVRRMRSEGPDSVLWQHEFDHLEGTLYLDRLLGELLPMDEVRRLREEEDARQGRSVSRRGRIVLEGAMV